MRHGTGEDGFCVERDYILYIMARKIRNTSQGNESGFRPVKEICLTLEVLRGDKICLSMKPVETAEDVYKIG